MAITDVGSAVSIWWPGRQNIQSTCIVVRCVVQSACRLWSTAAIFTSLGISSRAGNPTRCAWTIWWGRNMAGKWNDGFVKISLLCFLDVILESHCFCSAYIVHFLPCDAMHRTVLVIVILSVRPSVCLSVRLSHSWTVSTWLCLRSWFLHHMVAPSF